MYLIYIKKNLSIDFFTYVYNNNLKNNLKNNNVVNLMINTEVTINE